MKARGFVVALALTAILLAGGCLVSVPTPTPTPTPTPVPTPTPKVSDTEVVRAAADAYLSKVTTPNISATALFDNLNDGNKGNDPFILSVRSQTEYEKGHIPGSINIPWKEVAKQENLDKLPRDRQIVVYCNTGHTGSQVTAILNALGYNAITLMYGMGSWTLNKDVAPSRYVEATACKDYPYVTGIEPGSFAVRNIVTVAGSPVPLGDGGPATVAQLSLPYGAVIDSGNLYIGDASNNRVRRVDLTTGTITTFAGTGVAGSSGDGGPATAAQLNVPRVVAVGSGSLYITEYGGNRVRRVDLATGIITAIAGTGAAGFGGDGGPATAAQLNSPVGLALDSRNLYISDYVNNRVRRVDLATGTISTFAGTGVAGFSGDGGPATAAQLNAPRLLAVAQGNLYIADTANNRVRRVDLATGTITTFAGTGVAGFGGDSGPATAAQLSSPYGVALDSGNLYISDLTNQRIRRVDLATGTITTIAGTGVAGSGGDGGPATAAQLNSPVGLALGSGNLYIAQPAANRVRKVDLATGVITTFAGGGAVSLGDAGPATAAQLNIPYGVALDSRNIYIGDSANQRVRRVDMATGTITTFAGTGTAGFSGDGGPAAAAQLNLPWGIALDSQNLYIADSNNHRVRRVDLATGTITTFAGTGVAGFSGDGGPAAAAQLSDPRGVTVASGSLYISEYGGHRVRRVDLATGTITTFAGTGTQGFSGDGGLATAAQLNGPVAVALAPGSLYIADYGNYRVRRVDLATGTITTFGGTGAAGFSGDGGPATAAPLNHPSGLAVASGNLYIIDAVNNRIRSVDLATGVITTFAGTGVAGFSGDGGPATAAQLNTPYSVAIDPGNQYLYFSDRSNNRVRRVNLG